MNTTIDFDYQAEPDVIDGVPVLRISVGQPDPEAVIVHFHGGMYCAGTPEIDHVINAPLARATGMQVVSVDYRLAPEHPFPAAVDDAVAVHQALAGEGLQTTLFGESAGGGLVAACALRLRDQGQDGSENQNLPNRLALISPMLDLTGSSDTYRTNTHVDPDYGDTSALLKPAMAYAGDTSHDHPLVSPLFADLRGLPPTLIQVGGREVLLGDSTRFARRARAAGVPVELEVLDGGWHNYPIWYGLPEAAGAVETLADFLAPDRVRRGRS